MEKLDQFVRADKAAKRRLANTPRALAAHFDKRTGRIVIHLSTKLDLAFAPEDAEGLEGAPAAQLIPIEISPSGLGIHFPKLDADIYIPALFEGFLGSKKWIASGLGASGGRSTSDAKVSAAKENGRLGGRPRKRASAIA